MAFHGHQYVITAQTYKESKTMRDNLRIVHTDYSVINNKTVEFVNTFEAKNYPFFSMMWHPEYQLTEFAG
jgi:carbamoylphosphate synthase small subunit